MRKWDWDKQRLVERQRYAARKQLRELLTPQSPSFDKARQCVELVAQHHRLRATQLLGKNVRMGRAVIARHMAIHLIQRRTDLTDAMIGHLFSRDRATITGLSNRFQHMLDSSLALRDEVDDLLAELDKGE